MNILQFAPYFPPYPGGQEKYVHLLSRQLVRNGHRVSVITSAYPGRAGIEQVDGISVHRVPCYARILRNPISPGLFFPRIDLTRFDLIHAHNEHSSAALAAAWTHATAGIPLVVTCHGRLVFGNRTADAFRVLYWSSIGRKILRRAAAITVATPAEKRRIENQGALAADRIHVVPVGIDFDAWEANARQPLVPLPGSPSGGQPSRILLVATQLIQRKGIQYLLEALPVIRKVHPDVFCLIAGGGDFEPALRQMTTRLGLGSCVQFAGVLNMQQLGSAYRQACLFILPSLGEGQPTCIMEAWAHGCPVVATRIEGVMDYFSEHAFLAEPGDPGDLARTILSALNDPESARRLGQRGRRLVQEQFTWPRVTDKMMQVYETCLGART